ncbi:hypothetical protein [Streptomyces sp. NPDC048659]|uniref:hypothetical protein n=1 Tax=Streptomyces sp. NPDC048659 TaxID=3155489 RepID=UPI00341C6E6E
MSIQLDLTMSAVLDGHFGIRGTCHRKGVMMSNFLEWQDRMLRAVWRDGDRIPEEVSTWMGELYDERGGIPESEFRDSWTSRTFSMAWSAFKLVRESAEQDAGRATTGDDFSYIDYIRDPEMGPVGVVRIKSAEVSTPEWAEVLCAVAEGVQEFVMSHHRVTWPVCGEHGRGLHVDYLFDTAVWRCAGGATDGHVVRAIDPAVQL